MAILEQTAQIHAMQMKAEENFARHDRDIAQIDTIPLRRAGRGRVWRPAAGVDACPTRLTAAWG
jgi:hypothetical protein